jgi:purine-binding chemotaxis protein CheW
MERLQEKENMMNGENKTETRQYLTFRLDNDEYAINVENVREILELCSVTKVPQTPDYMLGVINLRGNVVPVIDLRIKFGFDCDEQTEESCIVVLEVLVDEELTVLGALVDSVQEVLELSDNDMEPPPKIGNRLKTEFIHGMGKRDDLFVIVLDINQIFSTSEINLLQQLEDETDAA